MGRVVILLGLLLILVVGITGGQFNTILANAGLRPPNVLQPPPKPEPLPSTAPAPPGQVHGNPSQGVGQFQS